MVVATTKVFGQHPSARLCKAALTALLYLTHQDKLDLFDVDDLSDPCRRRLGFLSDHYSDSGCVEGEERLEQFSERLSHQDDDTKDPLLFMGRTNPTIFRLAEKRGLTDLERKWSVYGYGVDGKTITPYSTEFDGV